MLRLDSVNPLIFQIINVPLDNDVCEKINRNNSKYQFYSAIATRHSIYDDELSLLCLQNWVSFFSRSVPRVFLTCRNNRESSIEPSPQCFWVHVVNNIFGYELMMLDCFRLSKKWPWHKPILPTNFLSVLPIHQHSTTRIRCKLDICSEHLTLQLIRSVWRQDCISENY